MTECQHAAIFARLLVALFCLRHIVRVCDVQLMVSLDTRGSGCVSKRFIDNESAGDLRSLSVVVFFSKEKL